MVIRHTVLALVLATTVLGQPPSPDTPAGRILTAWLAAFNSADPAKLRAFDQAHRPVPPLAQSGGFRQQTGGFALLRIEKSDSHSLVALLQEKNSDTVARFELSVSPEEPRRILKSALRMTPRPPDLAIRRMTEAEALSALSARAEELVKSDQFSGVLLVGRHGNVLLERVAGRADREAGTPVTLDTRFRLGSMNKMFTAIAALQLVEAGKMALEDPIRRHLPDYPNTDVAAKVTVRHLLTHTGGTGDIFGPEFAKNRLTLKEHSDYVKLYGSRAPVHEPGAEYRYSNYGFVLLGALIEKVSGMSYYDYVRAKVFQPAGMKSTDSLPEIEKVPNRAVGYTRQQGGMWVPNTGTLPWRGTAAGGGYSTVGDLWRFATALEAGKLISKTMLAQATKPQRQQYGYGFDVWGEGPTRNYGHGGGAPGMNGDLRVFPELGYVLVGLSNLDPPAATRLVDYFSLRMPASP